MNAGGGGNSSADDHDSGGGEFVTNELGEDLDAKNLGNDVDDYIDHLDEILFDDGISLLARELQDELNWEEEQEQEQDTTTTTTTTTTSSASPENTKTNMKKGGDDLHVTGKCYGCGARLQIITPNAAGFVDDETYKLKRKHKQHNTRTLCARCQGLAHGNLTSAVSGVAGAAALSAEDFVSTPEELRTALQAYADQKVLVVLLVDLADASGSLLTGVRNLVGGNPIMVVGTKADLLPKTCEPGAVRRWLESEAKRRGVGTLAGCYLTSSSDSTRRPPRNQNKNNRQKSQQSTSPTTRMPRGNLPNVVAAIRREQRGRDVVVVGAANVGKSAFINAMLDDMGTVMSPNFDPASNDAMRAKPTVSAMPGTTLRPLALASFSSGARLLDTPGVHLDHRLEQMLGTDDIKALHKSSGRSPMRGYAVGGPDAPLAGQTLFWGALIRIDVAKDAPPELELRFLGPKSLRITRLATHEDGAAWLVETLDAASEESEDDTAPFGAAAVARRGGMYIAREFEAQLNSRTDVAAIDIAPSGIGGWIRVGTARGARRNYGESSSAWLRVSAPKGVEVFLRPPLPVTSRESEMVEDADEAFV